MAIILMAIKLQLNQVMGAEDGMIEVEDMIVMIDVVIVMMIDVIIEDVLLAVLVILLLEIRNIACVWRICPMIVIGRI